MAYKIQLDTKAEINAIYFSLLATGYEYAEIDKSNEVLQIIKSVKNITLQDNIYRFFQDARQDTCEVYSYWPRAALLESAVFYINHINNSIAFDFNGYAAYVNGLKNLMDCERDEMFFRWIERFPDILQNLLENKDFIRINDEIHKWLDTNREHYINELNHIESVLCYLYNVSGMELKQIVVILSPFKCIYSADYEHKPDALIVILGAMRLDSVVHECLHPVVNSYVLKNKTEVLHSWNYNAEEVDKSYFLNGDENGILNAFEDLIVRKVTRLACETTEEIDIDSIIMQELA